ncbi:arsenic transporter [Rhodopseudomonas sp. P2A-2r]|uniref:arsenic transporter n=1 Tax=unclassified Rhodopseudomonas TaxID=2638247 RepID=UPI002234A38C|nr:arsenic transporter [Rhodopseudomonas sp. P2A-2r]UZE50182.1 arsenic transporter [Rhodopseudomonas sp. P2A-2r]
MTNNDIIWGVAGVATFGVIVRPFRLPEYVWALIGAGILVAFGLLPWRDAIAAAGKGTDVYLFLVGMMLLSEVARQQGLFDWLATHAVRQAKGSAEKLFLIVYGVGTLVTVFLSNDATAVVLTPAVYAAATAARVAPLPYLFICAFIANAASFVLPISNPANLVIFGEHMPPLGQWLYQFTLPSIASILVTYVALRFTQRHALTEKLAEDLDAQPLSLGGKCVAIGIGLTAAALLAASALDRQLGLPTFISGAAVTIVVLLIGRQSPLPVLRDVSWGVLPLVAGLFILVEAVEQTGILRVMAQLLHEAAAASPDKTAVGAGVIVAFASNLLNNLPTGLVAATISQTADVPLQVTSGLLIGVDLGPNLSVTGSLATILWLIALRREGEAVTAWQFLKLGIVVMPPALAAALLAMAVMP